MAESHGDRNTYRAEALYALRDRFDDPTPLQDVHVSDFDAAHRFEDGSTGPALRFDGTWMRLDDEQGAALRRYVGSIGLGEGAYLFGTVDVREGEPPDLGG